MAFCKDRKTKIGRVSTRAGLWALSKCSILQVRTWTTGICWKSASLRVSQWCSSLTGTPDCRAQLLRPTWTDEWTWPGVADSPPPFSQSSFLSTPQGSQYHDSMWVSEPLDFLSQVSLHLHSQRIINLGDKQLPFVLRLVPRSFKSVWSKALKAG